MLSDQLLLNQWMGFFSRRSDERILSDELILEILYLLDLDSFISMTRTSRFLANLASDEKFRKRMLEKYLGKLADEAISTPNFSYTDILFLFFQKLQKFNFYRKAATNRQNHFAAIQAKKYRELLITEKITYHNADKAAYLHYLRGQLYYHFNETAENINRSVAELKKAIKLKHTGAMVFLAKIYADCFAMNLTTHADLRQGQTLQQRLETVMTLLNTARAGGNTAATALMGNLYITGRELGLLPDLQKAIELLKEATEQKNADAALNLGEIYLKYKIPNLNDEQRLENFIYWLDQAVILGSKEAAIKLAKFYLDELPEMNISLTSPTHDIAKGIAYLKKAVNDLQSSEAAHHLGCIQIAGNIKGLDRDLEPQFDNYINIEKGITWFKLGLETSDTDATKAKCALALAFFYRSMFINPGSTKTVQWLQRGAALENTECMRLLGRLYLYGYLETDDIKTVQVTSDINRAEDLFTQALLRGDSVDFILSEYMQMDPLNMFKAIIKWSARGLALGRAEELEVFKVFFKGNHFDLGQLEPTVTVENNEMLEYLESAINKANFNFVQLPTQEIIDLAKACYEAIGLPAEEDKFISQYSQSESPDLSTSPSPGLN